MTRIEDICPIEKWGYSSNRYVSLPGLDKVGLAKRMSTKLDSLAKRTLFSRHGEAKKIALKHLGSLWNGMNTFA